MDGEVAVLFTADVVAIELRPEALMGFQQDHKEATILCMVISAQGSLTKYNSACSVMGISPPCPAELLACIAVLGHYSLIFERLY